MTDGLARLRDFVADFETLIAGTSDEDRILADGGTLLGDLVATDDWLPDAYAQPDPERYTQYLLHCDDRQRFCVVSFVWGPGQATPVHNHTVWGIVGVLRGAELSQAYRLTQAGLEPEGPPHRMGVGEVEAVSPRIGDVHQVSNAVADGVSVSIHVYGGNIGAVRRASFDPSGRPKTFISGYAKVTPPDLRAP